MPETPETPAALPEPVEGPALADFTPVPRLKDRHNGWKPEVQRAFILALAETGSVRAACRRVGRADHGAYQLRRHPQAASFRAAWDAALDHGIRRLEDAAMDRALYGTEETIHYHGEHVATRRRYNERLVMFMLRNRAPDRFAEGKARALNALDTMELARLKKQWRAEWERAAAIREDEDEDRALESLFHKLDALREAERRAMSPARRAATIAAEAQREADEEAGWRPGAPYEPYAAKAAALLPRHIEAVSAEWPSEEEADPVFDEAEGDEEDGEESANGDGGESPGGA